MSQDTPSQGTRQLITKSLKKVLSSLVRLVVRYGVTYPEFLELLKKVYVDEVRQDLQRKGDKVTLSRISVVSGVHRKDVKRLLEDAPDESYVPEKSSLTSRLISLWVGDSRFLDEQGEPRLLPRQGDLSFESLVREVSVDIRPRTVFDEWLDRGLLTEQAGQCQLNLNALFPSDDLATKVSFFARNTSDHIAACEHNLRGEQPPLPERSVFYNRLSCESVSALQDTAAHESQALLVKLNKQAQQLAREDDGKAEADHRFILGVYFYREQDQQDG